MFQEIPASNKSLGQRKSIFGIGINDADYTIKITVNNKEFKCPYYSRWHHVLSRCYSPAFKSKFPTYKDCTVCTDWLTFSNFKTWMIAQDWKEKEIDKDILVQGNKIYSPETCIFVSHQINKLLTDHKAKRGAYPQGVSWSKFHNRFMSSININGNRRHIGYFNSSSAASNAYKKAKYAIIKEIALKQSDPLKSALLAYRIE